MKNMINWLLVNKDLLEIVVPIFSLIVTTVLTIYIINQTNAISKKQLEQERLIHQQQKELQNKQIQLDMFDYRNNIYKAIYSVFKVTQEILFFAKATDLKQKTYEELQMFFEIPFSYLEIDNTEILWLFKQSKYIFPTKISSEIEIIAEHYDLLTGNIALLKLYPNILTGEEMQPYKSAVLDDIAFSCEKISSYIPYIESIMPYQMSIYK